jgi:hypothetical protein
MYVSVILVLFRVLIAAQLSWPTKFFVQVGIVLTTSCAGLYALIMSIRCLQVVARNKAFPMLNILLRTSKRPVSMRAHDRFFSERRSAATSSDDSAIQMTMRSSSNGIKANDVEAGSSRHSEYDASVSTSAHRLRGDNGKLAAQTVVDSPMEFGSGQFKGSSRGVPSRPVSIRQSSRHYLSRFFSCCNPLMYQSLNETSEVVFSCDDLCLLVCVFVAVMIPCLAGNLDNLAPIVSVIDLFVYFAINFTCFMLALMKGSVFRPRFGFESWWASLVGMTACFIVSLLLSWWLTVIVFAIFFALAVYAVQHKTVQDGFGDALYGFFFQIARNILYRLDEDSMFGLSLQTSATSGGQEHIIDPVSGEKSSVSKQSSRQQHVPDWRPKILVLVRTTDQSSSEDVVEGTSSSASTPQRGLSFRQTSAATTASSSDTVRRMQSASSRISSNTNVSTGNVSGSVGSTGEFRLKADSSSMIRLAGQIKTERGLTMVAAFIHGESCSFDHQMAAATKAHICDFMRSERVKGFCNVGVVTDVHLARLVAIQSSGIGPMAPNTVMTDWPNDWESLSPAAAAQHVDRYKAVISSKKALIVVKSAHKLRRNEVLVNSPRGDDMKTAPSSEINSHIDVWWVMHDGGLLMLLPHLLTLHSTWKNCRIRLFVVLTNSTGNPEMMKRRAKAYLDSVGIRASVETADLTSSEEQCLSVYEQTLDFKARLKLLAGMTALKGAGSATMTLAVRAQNRTESIPEEIGGIAVLARADDKDDKPFTAKSKRVHLANLFSDDAEPESKETQQKRQPQPKIQQRSGSSGDQNAPSSSLDNNQATAPPRNETDSPPDGHRRVSLPADVSYRPQLPPPSHSSRRSMSAGSGSEVSSIPFSLQCSLLSMSGASSVVDRLYVCRRLSVSSQPSVLVSRSIPVFPQRHSTTRLFRLPIIPWK